MANDLAGLNHWIIDTPSSVPLTTQRILVKSVHWVSKSASAGDDVSITNGANDRVVWSSVAPGSNFDASELIEAEWDGLTVPTLDSGTLDITYR